MSTIHDIRLNKLRNLTKELWKNAQGRCMEFSICNEKFVEERLLDPLQENCKYSLHRCRPDKIVFDFDPKPIYFEDKLIAIQLRELKKEKHLVIGCGNQPTTLAYDFALKPEVVQSYLEFFEDNIEHGRACIEQNIADGDIHKHEGAITINPDPEMNPTFVAFFGNFPAIYLPDNYFESYETEGILLDNLPYSQIDYKRILR